MGTVEVLHWLFEEGEKEKEQDNFEEARRRFEKILDMTRESDWVRKAHAALAEVFSAEEEFFWAMNHIEQALKIKSNCTHYHYLKGKIHYERDEFEAAASEALKAAEDDLLSAQYYQLLGKATYRCDSYETARRFLEWAVQCAPEEAEPRLELARLEVEEGNFRAALSVLKEALEETGENDKIREKIRIIQENWRITGS